jgi:glycosyltransferase involved in cell wall biosynthesis
MAPGPDKTAGKVLLVSYWYPPAVGAAAERVHAFAKYLPEHGWQARVLTAEHPGSGRETDRAVVHAVTDRWAGKGLVFPDYDPTVAKRSGLRSLLRELVFPDRFLAWQRAALKVGQGLIRQEACDLILASFPPASAVLLALKLHRESGARLVLDFRDRWLGPGGYEPRSAWAGRRHARLQHRAVSAAAALITVSDAMADGLAREQGYDRQRIFVIHNGYEPADPVAVQQGAATGDPMTIAHVGTVIARNRPELFLGALAELKGDDRLGGIVFRFVGNLSRTYLENIGLSSTVNTTGLLPRSKARREMQDAHALLLLTGSYAGKWSYNAKLFEYVQTGRPILCLEESPGSNDRKLLEQFAADRSFFAPVGDPEAIADQITNLRRYVRQHPAPALGLDDAFRAFSRPNLVAKLADHLGCIISRK